MTDDPVVEQFRKDVEKVIIKGLKDLKAKKLKDQKKDGKEKS